MIKTILEQDNEQTSQQQLTELLLALSDLSKATMFTQLQAEKDRANKKYDFFEFGKLDNDLNTIQTLLGLIGDLLTKHIK